MNTITRTQDTQADWIEQVNEYDIRVDSIHTPSQRLEDLVAEIDGQLRQPQDTLGIDIDSQTDAYRERIGDDTIIVSNQTYSAILQSDDHAGNEMPESEAVKAHFGIQDELLDFEVTSAYNALEEIRQETQEAKSTLERNLGRQIERQLRSRLAQGQAVFTSLGGLDEMGFTIEAADLYFGAEVDTLESHPIETAIDPRTIEQPQEDFTVDCYDRGDHYEIAIDLHNMDVGDGLPYSVTEDSIHLYDYRAGNRPIYSLPLQGPTDPRRVSSEYNDEGEIQSIRVSKLPPRRHQYQPANRPQQQQPQRGRQPPVDRRQ